MRNSWILRAMARAAAASSACPTPTSDSSPRPISPTTAPSTVTAAVPTLLTTARTRPSSGRGVGAVPTPDSPAAGLRARSAVAGGVLPQLLGGEPAGDEVRGEVVDGAVGGVGVAAQHGQRVGGLEPQREADHADGHPDPRPLPGGLAVG